jgi:Arc/MetJ family transcription regulator
MEIELDDALLEAAALALGTTTAQETVSAALAYIVGRKPRQSFFGQDITGHDVMKQAPS